jgi:hypothetical protein
MPSGRSIIRSDGVDSHSGVVTRQRVGVKPPDDKLQRVTQYAVPSAIFRKPAITGYPLSRV